MGASQPYASVDDLIGWAEDLIESRKPDFIIGDNYLRRWWVVPRNHLQNVYLHEINKSDDDRALHDHPWDNVSVLLRGGYTEVTPEGTFERKAGEVIHRPATALHRLIVPNNAKVVSLFFTGPRIREWGFDCPQGWRHWKDFTSSIIGADGVAQSVTGRGCGEM